MIFAINDFEGPLDLLLHLIKANKMDIYNIDISLITKEYLHFIDKNKDLTIDQSSEYLVMASELIHLKSKVLLNGEIEEDDYEFTSAEDLTKRLLEYEKIKNISEEFRILEDHRKKVFTKIPSSLDKYTEKFTSINTDITLNDLLDAFSDFLNREKLKQPVDTKVTKKEYSIEKRCMEIRNKLKSNAGKVKFIDLFDSVSKPYVVVTFLSILNMSKNGEIVLIQKNNFKDIFLEMGDKK